MFYLFKVKLYYTHENSKLVTSFTYSFINQILNLNFIILLDTVDLMNFVTISSCSVRKINS